MDPERAAEQVGRKGGRSHPDDETQAGRKTGDKGGMRRGCGVVKRRAVKREVSDGQRYTTTVNSRPSPSGSSMDT
jgi:hypothetical protein